MKILLMFLSVLFIVMISWFISDGNGLPSMKLLDQNLTIKPVIENLTFFPTNMAFLDENNILVLDKTNGTVRLVNNGSLAPSPLLTVNVSSTGERGLLGIAIDNNTKDSKIRNVFLYYTGTEAENQDQQGNNSGVFNRLYKYDLINNTIVNPDLLLKLPADPGFTHNGGAITIGPDGNIYLPYGDLSLRTETQNINNGPSSSGTGGILRISTNGTSVNDGFSLGANNLSLFYAYGIRNSFGIDFDPLSGKLWDTENGPDYGDEINLVEPGFNSGWLRVQGEWSPKWSSIPGFGAFMGEKITDPQNLVTFNNTGHYSSPEFMTANFTIGPTAIKFLTSKNLGDEYQYDVFVGDIHNGNLYHFKLNETRDGFILPNLLADKIANSRDELKGVLLGEGLGSITDIEEGPDGYLYILSAGRDAIYKIAQK